MVMKQKLVSIAFCVGLAWIGTAHALPLYTITDLGKLPGDTRSSASSVNDAGQVVGISSNSSMPNNSRAFIWENGIMSNLGNLPGGDFTRGFAAEINNMGQVVGTDYVKGNPQGFLWQNGTMTPLGNLPGAYQSEAYAINDIGQVVGSNSSYAFIWQNGAIDYLRVNNGPNPATLLQGLALDINNAGQVVGAFDIPNISATHAFLFSHGVLTDLGILGSKGGYKDSSFAFGINDLGQAVGVSIAPTGDRAFLWENGVMIDLGDLPGGSDSSIAYDINDLGQVVGNSGAIGGATAFLWQNDTMVPLFDLIDPNLGWTTLQDAYSINDHGQVVGYGTINGESHAFLLSPASPVPEPSTLALILAASVGAFSARGLRGRA
jgi:probable HAF family extracellular repeat protein